MSVLSSRPLGFVWETADPFLFCVHHDDAYPAGNGRMGPLASLAGRNLGQDFEGRDGWRMYHGSTIPGFPPHPHRGFETVTILRKGYVDHSDSLGAAARFGPGDVQWMTAGKGVVHSEMFPMLRQDAPNPLELFQIWLNLPAADKLVEPHFAMLWGTDIPTVREGGAEVTVIAGAFGGARPPSPPPKSWASRPTSEVAILTVKMEPGARLVLPPASVGINRSLFLFDGGRMSVGGRDVAAGTGMRLRPEVPTELVNGERAADLLLLQGRPIGEPVVQHGPFVMNHQAEIRQAFADYQRTRFGGWPWPGNEPVHPASEGRFARHADGRVERPVVA